MKRSSLFIIAIISLLAFSSCNKEEKTLYDFGQKTFDEPFQFGYRPAILEQSLRWVLFSWLMDDTVKLEKDYEIEMNIDGLRSRSCGKLLFVDTLMNKMHGVEFSCNGKKVENGEYAISPKGKQQFNIGIKIPPCLGDTILKGKVLLVSDNIDTVNNLTVDGQSEVVGEWKAEQKIGLPIIIWGLWLLIIVAILYLSFCILKLIIVLIKLLPRAILPKPRKQPTPWATKFKKVAKKMKEKKEDEEKEDDEDRELTAAEALRCLRRLYDYILIGTGPDIGINKRMINEKISKLPEPWKSIIDHYNSQRETSKPDFNRGHWSNNDRNNAFWTPDENEMPVGEGKDKRYNPKQLTLRQMMKEIGNVEYIEFFRGYPNFKPFAYTTFSHNVSIDTESNRNKLHRYFKKNVLPGLLNCKTSEVERKLGEMKATIHENTDGTFSLVHLSIHRSIPHDGGRTLCEILKKGTCLPTIKNSEFINRLPV